MVTATGPHDMVAVVGVFSGWIIVPKVIHIPFLEPCKEPDVTYSCMLGTPEQLLEYPLSIFGVGDSMSNGPLVGENLVIIATLIRFVAKEMNFIEAFILDVS